MERESAHTRLPEVSACVLLHHKLASLTCIMAVVCFILETIRKIGADKKGIIHEFSACDFVRRYGFPPVAALPQILSQTFCRAARRRKPHPPRINAQNSKGIARAQGLPDPDQKPRQTVHLGGIGTHRRVHPLFWRDRLPGIY